MAQISNAWFEREFSRSPVMVILRGYGVTKSLQLATRAWDLGIDSVEVPIQTNDDIETLTAVVDAARSRGKNVGAGTILTNRDVELAAAAGAAYTVSPGFDRNVVQDSLDAGLPSLPGVATASEIQAALALGITWLKAFPAGVLGPAWFRAMAGPFPAANFVATGGLTASHAEPLLNSNVKVVSLGSALEDPNQLDQITEILTTFHTNH